MFDLSVSTHPITRPRTASRRRPAGWSAIAGIPLDEVAAFDRWSRELRGMAKGLEHDLPGDEPAGD